MLRYTDLLDIFDEHGIKDSTALNRVIHTLRGRRSSEEYPHQDSFGGDFCRSIARMNPGSTSLHVEGGIQQFSLNAGPRIKESDVKKALFLARTSTIFTKHVFEHNVSSFWNSADAESSSQEWWNISSDFVENVFQFRKAIRAGQLVILPVELKVSETMGEISGYTSGGATTIDLLDQLEETRVFHSQASPALIDAFVSRYKQNQQLISLPDLWIPWIQNADLNSVIEIRQEQEDFLAAFQKAYHAAVQAYITNYRSLDFARLSREINDDVVAPRIAALEKNYRQIVSNHRSLALTGAAVALIPISGTIITASLLGHDPLSDMIKGFPPAIAGLIASIGVNHINKRNAEKKLEDEPFYIVWKIRED